MITSTSHVRARVICEPEKYSLKRAAWAYGCAAKGSAEEAALLAVLVDKLAATKAAP